MDRKEEAWVEINKAIEIDPENSWNWGYAANFEFYDNHIDRAIYRQRKACELNPKFGGCAARVGFYYANLDAEEETLAWIDKALELSPASDYVWSFIAENLARLGRIEKAYEYIEEANRLFPGNSSWFLVQVSRDLKTGEKEKLLQSAYKFYPQLAAEDDFVIDQHNIWDVLDYSWVLLVAGDEDRTRHTVNRTLVFVDEYCSLPGNEADKDVCNSRYRAYAYLKDREQTLNELKRLIIEDQNLVQPYLAPNASLNFLHDDPEFQRLMAALAEIKAAQLKRVREMERSGEIPPPPWDTDTTQ
jgi:tetratricopeptide (TPR) repeat protein